MRALITGGAGFIGSHLAETLLAQGHEVDVIDNLSTGSIRNIAHLKSHTRFKYVIDTLTNEPLLAELIDRNDVVFHFAAAVGVKLIVEQPVHTIETNVHGTEVVLKHANKKKECRHAQHLMCTAKGPPAFHEAPSWYGDHDQTPMGVRVQQCDRRLPGARLLQIAHLRSSSSVLNTVGPRQRSVRPVLPSFVLHALAGKPITLFSTARSRALHLCGRCREVLVLSSPPRAFGQVSTRQREEVRFCSSPTRQSLGLGDLPSVHPYDNAYEADSRHARCS